MSLGTRSPTTTARPGPRRRGLRAALAGLALAGMTGSSAYAATCSPTMDRMPFQFRALQSTLMVAALTCDVRNQYNDFVVKFQASLARNGRALDGQFRRLYGAASERHLNRFITELANDASIVSIKNRDGFCDDARKTLQHLAQIGVEEVESFARERFEHARVEEKVCTAQRM